MRRYTPHLDFSAAGLQRTEVHPHPHAAPMNATADADDRDLIARIAARDSRALADLYDRHSRLLFSLAYRMLQHRGDAEEVLQEVFLEVWTRVSTYNRAFGSPAAWLVRMTRTRAIDRLRVHRPHRRLATHVEVPAPAQSAATSVQGTPSGCLDADALRTLMGEQRELIEAAYFEGLTESELAARFQLPLATVETRIRTGLTLLREELARVRYRKRERAEAVRGGIERTVIGCGMVDA